MKDKLMGFDDKGPWSVPDITGLTIESEDFTHDVILSIGGDFGSNEDRSAYAQGLAEVLNKHNEQNNSVDNLQIMTASEHARHHAAERYKRRGIDKKGRFA